MPANELHYEISVECPDCHRQSFHDKINVMVGKSFIPSEAETHIECPYCGAETLIVCTAEIKLYKKKEKKYA